MRNGVGSWLSIVVVAGMCAAFTAAAAESWAQDAPAPAAQEPNAAAPYMQAPGEFAPGSVSRDGGFRERLGPLAQGSEAAPPEREEYIILDVKDKDLREVLSAISRKVGVNIVADKQVDEKVTVQLDRVEWRLALRHIAQITDCRIIEESDRLIRFTQPPSVSMEFQDADLKIVLDLLAKQSGANIVVAENVKGNVSLSLREVPWEDALNTIVKTAGYTIVEDVLPSTGTKILRVVHPSSLVTQLETAWIQLRFVRPDSPYQAVITNIQNQAMSPLLDEEGKVLSPESKKGEKSVFTLLTAMRQLLSPHGSIQYDPVTNSFYVKDIKTRIDEIKKIVAQIDKEPPQVHVKVRFVVTSNTDLLETGIRFVDTVTGERRGANAIVRGQPGDDRFFFSDATGDRHITDKLMYWGSSFPFNLGPWHAPMNGFHALGVLDFSETKMLLELIEDDDASRIVQQPELTTIDKRPATIFVGESVPFAEQGVQQDQSGNVTVTLKENKRSPVSVGFTLYIIPNVIPQSEDIDMCVIPKINALTGKSSPLDGFERFSFGMTQIDLPREQMQTVVTTMRVQHGHTALIGGLQTENRREITTRVPLLSSIPVLGHIFTYHYNRTIRDAVLITLTPTIMQNTDMLEQVSKRSMEEVMKNDHFTQQALKQSGKAPAKGKEPEKK